VPNSALKKLLSIVSVASIAYIPLGKRHLRRGGQLICNQQVIGSNPIAGSVSPRADRRAIRDRKNTVKNRDGRTKVALKIDLYGRGPDVYNRHNPPAIDENRAHP
jgi:hypothetical protein